MSYISFLPKTFMRIFSTRRNRLLCGSQVNTETVLNADDSQPYFQQCIPTVEFVLAPQHETSWRNCARYQLSTCWWNDNL